MTSKGKGMFKGSRLYMGRRFINKGDMMTVVWGKEAMNELNYIEK